MAAVAVIPTPTLVKYLEDRMESSEITREYSIPKYIAEYRIKVEEISYFKFVSK